MGNRLTYNNLIGLSINLLMLLGLTHLCFPRARRHTRKFFELSYYNPQSGEYTAGWDDAYMVVYWLVIFTGLRAGIMDFVLTPLAKLGGIKDRNDVTRFAEQAWLLIYCSVFWSLGMVGYSLSYTHYKSDQILVYHVLFRLLAQPQSYVGKLAKSGNQRSFEVVYSCPVRLLATADHGCQH